MLVSVIDEDADDALRSDELVPAGGSWNGLLFDNPRLGLAPALTWTFTFRFQDVVRDTNSAVSVDVDWVPLPAARWQDITPQQVASRRFAEPVEAKGKSEPVVAWEAVRAAAPDGPIGRVVAEHLLEDGGTASRIVLADWYDKGSLLRVTPDGAKMQPLSS